ncbi:MAG: serine/threonine transporter SstT [Cyanobacteria bacterium SIG32]|nr:serine/threonine transporter SstT [Cyanobacteria bacterium SIG32]
MKTLVKKYNDINLVSRIFVGILIGIVLAIFLPELTAFSVLGDLFVGALKAIAPMLVFILVMNSLAQGIKHSGGKFRTVIGLYMFSTFLAAITAVIASFLFPQTLSLNTGIQEITSTPESLSEIIHNLLVKIVINPISSLSESNYLGILFWAIITGMALKDIVSDSTKDMLKDFSTSVSQIVSWIINLAPFGIMGLVFRAVSTNGVEIFTQYGKLILLLACCMVIVALVTNPIIISTLIRQNPYPLILRCLKESGITAFFTRSSAANIPVNMKLCEELELDKDMYNVSIPLGATINMSGGAVTITIMALAAAHTLGIETTFTMSVILSVLATFAACGASGIAGGSLLLIPSACSLFGIPNDIAIQVVGVGFIISVLQDSLETALNSSSDVVFTATADYYQRRKNP